MRLVMFTNNSPSGKYLMNQLTTFKHFESVIIELKYKNILEKFFQRIFGYVNYSNFKQFLELRKTKENRQIYKIEKKYIKLLNKSLKSKSSFKGKLLKVRNINDSQVIQHLKNVKPDLIIVFGTYVIKEDLLRTFPYTQFVNIHFSILPYYRGSKPEFWQFYNKDYDKVGITLHIVEKNVDTGPILCQAHTKVNSNDNYITIRYANLKTAINLIKHNLEKIEKHLINPIPQDLNKHKTYKYNMFQHRRYDYWKEVLHIDD